ncbi:MAG: hypothetical protein AAB091_01210 [Elusimicrobiota bacterium]
MTRDICKKISSFLIGNGNPLHATNYTLIPQKVALRCERLRARTSPATIVSL